MSYNTKVYMEQGGDKLVVNGGEIDVIDGIITKDGTQANHIADIANDASGTVIATAVNAIIAVLEDIGATKTS